MSKVYPSFPPQTTKKKRRTVRYSWFSNFTYLAYDEHAPESRQHKTREGWQAYLQLLLSVTGLVAGFTYIATTNAPVFNEEFVIFAGKRSDIRRIDFYAFFVISAFMFALTATLVGAIMYSWLVFVHDTDVHKLLNKMRYIGNLPLMFLVVGIGAMLAGGVLAIGGISKTDWMNRSMYVVGACCIAITFLIGVYVWTIGNQLTKMRVLALAEEKAALLETANNATPEQRNQLSHAASIKASATLAATPKRTHNQEYRHGELEVN
jgi:hypothetical protein